MRVRKIFIAGAGKIGQGIAQSAASSGISVILSDVDKSKIDLGMKSIEKNLNAAIEKWAITVNEKKAILSRIKCVIGIDETEDCDFGFEAVPENIDLKKKIFRELDSSLPEEAIIVTTTSTLAVSEISAATKRETQAIGMHFLFPVERAQIVEIVRGRKTSKETFERAVEFVGEIGKEFIEASEYPGFVITRIMLPFINEAIHVLMEGIAEAEDIDRAIKLGFGLPFGPLELADTIGLDNLMVLMESMYRELGDIKYKPCPLLRRKVRDGKIGKQVGRGFFVYDEDASK
ncbi:MAG: 3-hydroxyacyl-CoA dehydrogenase family protein [bacterium]